MQIFFKYNFVKKCSIQVTLLECEFLFYAMFYDTMQCWMITSEVYGRDDIKMKLTNTINMYMTFPGLILVMIWLWWYQDKVDEYD